MAKLILTDSDQGTQFELNAGPSWEVTGTSGTDNIKILAGAEVTLNLLGGTDTITMPANFADFSVEVKGTTVEFTDGDGKVIAIPASTTANTLNFPDGSSESLVIDLNQGAIVLGDINLSDGGGGSNEPQTINISGDGTRTATSSQETFVFASDTYAHTISGFTDGDILDFPESINNLTISNNSGSDGEVDIFAVDVFRASSQVFFDQNNRRLFHFFLQG